MQTFVAIVGTANKRVTAKTPFDLLLAELHFCTEDGFVLHPFVLPIALHLSPTSFATPCASELSAFSAEPPTMQNAKKRMFCVCCRRPGRQSAGRPTLVESAGRVDLLRRPDLRPSTESAGRVDPLRSLVGRSIARRVRHNAPKLGAMGRHRPKL